MESCKKCSPGVACSSHKIKMKFVRWRTNQNLDGENQKQLQHQRQVFNSIIVKPFETTAFFDKNSGKCSCGNKNSKTCVLKSCKHCCSDSSCPSRKHRGMLQCVHDRCEREKTKGCVQMSCSVCCTDTLCLRHKVLRSIGKAGPNLTSVKSETICTIDEGISLHKLGKTDVKQESPTDEPVDLSSINIALQQKRLKPLNIGLSHLIGKPSSLTKVSLPVTPEMIDMPQTVESDYSVALAKPIQSAVVKKNTTIDPSGNRCSCGNYYSKKCVQNSCKKCCKDLLCLKHSGRVLPTKMKTAHSKEKHPILVDDTVPSDVINASDVSWDELLFLAKEEMTKEESKLGNDPEAEARINKDCSNPSTASCLSSVKNLCLKSESMDICPSPVPGLVTNSQLDVLGYFPDGISFSNRSLNKLNQISSQKYLHLCHPGENPSPVTEAGSLSISATPDSTIDAKTTRSRYAILIEKADQYCAAIEKLSKAVIERISARKRKYEEMKCL